jgi:hypothetical protein
MLEKGTPLHDFVNTFAAESVRFKHIMKDCATKRQCHNVGIVYGSFNRLEDAVDKLVQELKDV